MECHTLDELKNYFEVKLASLSTGMDLVSIASEPYGVKSECRDQLNLLERDLLKAEATVAQIKDWVRENRKQLQAAQVLRDNLSDVNRCLRHMEGNLPGRLPNRTGQQHKQPSEERMNPPLQSKPVTENSQSSHPAGPSSTARPGKPPPAPLMDFITVPEFKDVPKYMKGRMTYDSVNTAVEGFNAAVTAKYRLMKRPRSGLNDRDRKQYQAYKEQENKDTKGVFFVTEDDLRKLGSFKMDSSARAVLTVLRHCGRMREIRGSGVTRFALIH